MKSKGLVQVYCGNGKGKTTAAVGQALRALYYDYKVLFVQFLKTKKQASGEIHLLSEYKNCEVISSDYTHPNFYAHGSITHQLVESDQKRVFHAMEKALEKKWDMVVLDEILNSCAFGYIPKKTVVQLIKKRSPNTELILTGRKRNRLSRKYLDLITEFRELKHPFQTGIRARKGIEY